MLSTLITSRWFKPRTANVAVRRSIGQFGSALTAQHGHEYTLPSLVFNISHTQRYHAQTRTAGYGHLYRGRYKSPPVEIGPHFLTLVRYVERNPQRAGLPSH